MARSAVRIPRSGYSAPTRSALGVSRRGAGRRGPAISKYPQKFVDTARRQIDAQVEAFRKLARRSRRRRGPHFNDVVLALERHFVHRALEK